MTDWKAAERRVAAMLGGRRIPVTGIDRAGADVVSPLFHVQVKRRRRLPGWLWAWLGDICSTAKQHSKVGVLVLGQPGQRHTESLVVMRMADFRDLYGDLKAVPDDTRPPDGS